MSQVYRIQDNYRETLRQAVGKPLSDAFSTETADTDTLRRDVKKDLPRTVYFTRNPALIGEEGETAKPIQDLWRQEDTYPAYTQGNIDSRVMSEVLMVRVEQQFMMKGDMEYIEARRTSIGFGYIDKNGIECGFSVSHSNKYPGIFCVALGKNMRVGSPDEREMTVYVSSAGPDTPSLKDVIVEGYSDDNLQDQATMREELLGDDSLPDEVKALIREVLTPEGKLDIDRAKEISESLKTGSANHTVFFKQERQAQQDLSVYQRFCEHAIGNLSKIKGEKSEEALALKGALEATLDKITRTLDANKDAPQTGEYDLMGKHAEIQGDILRHLDDAMVNTPYQQTLKTMQARFDHASRSFGERRGTSTRISGALTVLAVAGAAIIAAGLLVNPIGLAIASAASVAVGAASLISWGVAAYKEFSLAQERGALGQALTEEVGALVKSGGQKAMLDMVVDNTRANDASEATTSFKEAYRQATQKVEDTSSEDDEKVGSDAPKGP